MESFDPATQQGLGITNLFWLELVISAALLAIVVAWMLACVCMQPFGLPVVPEV